MLLPRVITTRSSTGFFHDRQSFFCVIHTLFTHIFTECGQLEHMSFKMTRVAPHSIPHPSKQPEIVTIPDSDEEESQDLFDSASDAKNVSVEHEDSDDLFSCSGSEAGSPVKRSSTGSLPPSKVQG